MRGLIPFDGFFGDSVLDDFFDNVPEVYAGRVSAPKVNIEDKKDHYEVTCDVPGFDKDEVQVKFNDGILTISGRKDQKNETEDKKHHFLRRERNESAFQRSFALDGIQENGISASMNDGVLTVKLPKQQKAGGDTSHNITIG